MKKTFSFETSVPSTLNQALRAHWGRYSDESELIGKEIRSQLRLCDTIKKAKVTINRFSSGTLDRDNKFFTSKHILDNLVKMQILENDTEDNIVELTVNQIKIKRGEKRKLVVTIEEVA